MKNTKLYIIAILLSFINSCIDPYNPNISKYESVFVVDGEINNLPGPYVVKLSRSFKFKDHEGDPVSGAKLKIIDNNGLEAELAETSEGVYTTIDSTFQGIVGNSYKLQIKLNDETFESEFETLKEPVEIDNLYWEYEVRENNVDGVQIYLDTHDPNNNTHFYSWEFEETWKFMVPIDVNDKSEWKECFTNQNSLNFDIATTTLRKQDIIERHPLLFIGENTNRIYIRYSMLVRQFALNYNAYKYLKDVVTLNQEQGSLFDPTPFSLVGNMKNLSDKNMPVLGYFLVAGASEKRIFIDRYDLPRSYYPTDGFDECSSAMSFVPIALRNNYRADAVTDSIMKLGYRIYEEYEVILQSGDTVMHLLMAKPYCYNCTLSGDPTTPDFWIEKNED